jgi:hypothetical protein
MFPMKICRPPAIFAELREAAVTIVIFEDGKGDVIDGRLSESSGNLW